MDGPQLVDLNVGGTRYSTTIASLTSQENSLFSEWFHKTPQCPLSKDSEGRYFIDRDGVLFRYVLDFMRQGVLVLPERFPERARLIQEAIFFKLPDLEALLMDNRNGTITVGYQGSFYFGRQGMGADISFRKVSRILVCGRVSLCREAFGETLNEGRDPDRGHDDRYTSRFFLKHSILEQAFDALTNCGFHMVGSAASGTSNAPTEAGVKPASGSTEEERWAHYNEFIFIRP